MDRTELDLQWQMAPSIPVKGALVANKASLANLSLQHCDNIKTGISAQTLAKWKPYTSGSVDNGKRYKIRVE